MAGHLNPRTALKHHGVPTDQQAGQHPIHYVASHVGETCASLLRWRTHLLHHCPSKTQAPKPQTTMFADMRPSGPSAVLFANELSPRDRVPRRSQTGTAPGFGLDRSSESHPVVGCNPILSQPRSNYPDTL